MTIASVQLSLLIGRAVPTAAPAALMSALQSVEVTQQTETSGFQITFRADRGARVLVDYGVLQSTLLQPGNRVVIVVTANATPRVLMDGIITHQQLAPDSAGVATLTVTGEDLSVMMDLYEIPMEYPGLGDAAIAAAVLLKYAAFGVVPVIIPPITSLISLPLERVPQQSSTDRQYLRWRAQANGHIFFVRPGPAPLTNVAYWGPITRVGLPQKALTVDSGPATNVESISFSYDALAPAQVYGAVSDQDLETIVPVLTFASTRLPPLASQPPLLFNQPFVRKTMLDYQGASAIEAWALAQSITDASSDDAVTAQGELNVLRYGDILTAPGIVGVRGVGGSYDGLYYVKSVSHQISLGHYTQRFTLTREGLGSLTNTVMP